MSRLNNIEMCRQGPVVELLSQWKAAINPNQAAGALCEAASRYLLFWLFSGSFSLNEFPQRQLRYAAETGGQQGGS